MTAILKKYENVKELAGGLSWKPLVSLGFEITRRSGSGGSLVLNFIQRTENFKELHNTCLDRY
jgi:hypothetical protein